MKPIHQFAWVLLPVLVFPLSWSCKDDEEPSEPKVSKEAAAPAAEVKAKKPEPRKKPVKATPEELDARQKIAAASTNRPPDRLTPTADAPKPPRPAPAVKESLLPDLRLLLTATDVTQAGDKKTVFRKRPLPGMAVTPEQDALYYEPEKDSSYGFGIQVFRERNTLKAKQRFESMFASYPNSVEIAPVAGDTFFAFWDEVLFVSFMHPYNGMIVVLSCGRPYCDSDSLYALSKKVSVRLK